MSAKTRSSSSSSIDDDEGQVYSEQRMLGYSAEKMFQVGKQWQLAVASFISTIFPQLFLSLISGCFPSRALPRFRSLVPEV